MFKFAGNLLCCIMLEPCYLLCRVTSTSGSHYQRVRSHVPTSSMSLEFSSILDDSTSQGPVATLVVVCPVSSEEKRKDLEGQCGGWTCIVAPFY